MCAQHLRADSRLSVNLWLEQMLSHSEALTEGSKQKPEQAEREAQCLAQSILSQTRQRPSTVLDLASASNRQWAD